MGQGHLEAELVHISNEGLQAPAASPHASFPASSGEKLCLQQPKTSLGSKMGLMRSRQWARYGDHDRESRIG